MEIRSALPRDVPDMLEIYGPCIRDTIISFESEVPSVEAFTERLSSYQSKLPWIVLEENHKVIGYAYASPHRERAAYRWSCEVSVYVHSDHRRKGVAQQLYARLFDLLKDFDIHMCFAGISLPNPASVKCHESFGFTPIGVYHEIGYKFGQWIDVGWWEKKM